MYWLYQDVWQTLRGPDCLILGWLQTPFVVKDDLGVLTLLLNPGARITAVCCPPARFCA